MCQPFERLGMVRRHLGRVEGKLQVGEIGHQEYGEQDESGEVVAGLKSGI